jgi:ABC-type antimicrobial peptide transport system permease subunit
VLLGVFSHAALLVGGGIAAGNLLLAIVATQVTQIYPWRFVAVALLITSVVMVAVGALACVVPARRALQINPTDALRQT